MIYLHKTYIIIASISAGGYLCPRNDALAKLARDLLKFCASLISSLKKTILSEDFIARHRQSPDDFTRERILTFGNLVAFLVNLVKGSLQDELDHFFQVIRDRTVPVQEVTKSALCRARKKLRPEAFVELTDKLTAHFYDRMSHKRWRGFRLLAIDGSTCKVPNTKAVAKHFGVWHAATGDPCPLARVSQLFDVLNHLTVHALIRPKEESERSLAAEHLRYAKAGDLILLDRGYPAFWLFAMIRSAGAHFCCRMTERTWDIVRDFAASGRADHIVTLTPGPAALKRCEAMGLPVEPIKLRLVRVVLDTGEHEILATSLLDQGRYRADLFGDLYQRRWGVEESYKVWKQRIQVERWTGKSVTAVLQDFHAKVFTANLASVIARSARDIVAVKTKHRKHVYAVNFAQALSKMKDVIALLFTRRGVLRIVTELIDVITKTIEPIRPGRKYPRRFKVGATMLSPTYKPIR